VSQGFGEPQRWSQLIREQVLQLEHGDKVAWMHREAWRTGTARGKNAAAPAVGEDGTGVMWGNSPAALVAEPSASEV